MNGSLAAFFPDRVVGEEGEAVDQCAQLQAPPPQHPESAVL